MDLLKTPKFACLLRSAPAPRALCVLSDSWHHGETPTGRSTPQSVTDQSRRIHRHRERKANGGGDWNEGSVRSEPAPNTPMAAGGGWIELREEVVAWKMRSTVVQKPLAKSQRETKTHTCSRSVSPTSKIKPSPPKP